MLSVPRLLREPRHPVTAMPLMPRSRPGNYDPTRSPNCTSPSSATSHSLCALSPAWHPATLPRNISIFIDQGVVYNGNIARLRSLRHSRRNPLVVAAFGASMTAEHGGQARHLHGCRCAHPGWLLPIIGLLEQTFTQRQIRLINAGRSGHTLAGYLQCFASRVPVDLSLVIIEASSVPQQPHIAEALIRWLLALPSAPAVLLLHLPTFIRVELPGHSRPKYLWSSEHNEAALTAIARHYELPVLSAYAALFSTNGRSVTREGATEENTGALLWPGSATRDGTHPRDSDQGLRYQALVAALVNRFLFATLRDDNNHHRSQMHGRGRLRGRRARCVELPTPLHEPTPSWLPSLERCFTFEPPGPAHAPGSLRHGMGASSPRATTFLSSVSLLPGSHGWAFTKFDNATHADGRGRGGALQEAAAPLEQANQANATTEVACSSAACMLRRALLPQRLVLRRGSRQGLPLAVKPKPGLTAFHDGSVALLRLASPLPASSNMTPSSPHAAPYSPSVRGALVLTHLESYEGMGMAAVQCLHGCECASLILDAHHSRRSSIFVAARLDLLLTAAVCVISVTVVNASNSAGNGHKFKIGEVTLSAQLVTQRGTAANNGQPNSELRPMGGGCNR